MPTGECCEEDEAEEGENDGDDAKKYVSSAQGLEEEVGLQKVWEYYRVLESRGDPDQVEWILVHSDNLSQRRGVGVANVRSAVRLHADTEVTHTDFEFCGADNI